MVICGKQIAVRENHGGVFCDDLWFSWIRIQRYIGHTEYCTYIVFVTNNTNSLNL